MPLNNPQPSIDQNSVAISGGTITGVTLSTSTSQTVNLGAGLTITSQGAIQTTGVGSGAIAGNARGSGAVDLQITRLDATRVASGANAFAAGSENTASGSQSVALGTGNTASGNQSVALGNTNSASGNIAVALGNSCTSSNSATFAVGSSCTASAPRAVSIGQSNTASAQNSTALGIRSTARIQGQLALASGGISSTSNAIGSLFVLQVETTNASVTEMVTAATERITLQNDSTMAFSALISARRADADNESASYKLEGCIDRNASAGTTALVGSVAKTVLAEDTVAWDVNAIADTTNGALRFEVTGEAAKTIRWVAFVQVSEVVG